MQRLAADVVTDHPRTPLLSVLLAVLAIALVVLVSRVPLIGTARHGSELTTDEADLSMMALDRYFGTPHTNVHWPGLTNQMLMMPLIGVDFVVAGHQPRNAEGFARFAGTQYRDSTGLVVLHRALIVVLTTLAAAALAWSLRSRGLLVMVAAALLLQNAHLIVYGTMGLGNGTAMAAMIGILACAVGIRCHRKRSVAIGLLFGLALASRNTSILLTPLLVGLLWESGETLRARLRPTLLMIAGTIAGSAPAWSAMLLDPIRWLKANLGNFVKTGAPVGPANALHVLLNAGGWPFWIATLAAVVWLMIRRRHAAVVIGWAVSFVGAVIISGRSPLVETRYFDAVVLGGTFVCLLAVRDVIAADRRAGVRAGVVGATAVLAVLGWWSAWRLFKASEAGLYPEARAIAARLQSAEKPLIVDRELLPNLMARADAASLRTAADRVDEAMRRGAGVQEFVARFHLDPAVAIVFTQDLTEKEQCAILRLRTAAAVPPLGDPIALQFAGDSNTAQRYGSLSVDEAIGQVRRGEASEAVLAASSIASLDTTGVVVRPIDGAAGYVSVKGR